MVALNLSDDDHVVPGIEGTIRIATDRSRDGEAVAGPLTLDAWSGVIIER